jgi:hypothetical protein
MNELLYSTIISVLISLFFLTKKKEAYEDTPFILFVFFSVSNYLTICNKI